MTTVTELNSQPVAANPNALFYCSENVDGAQNVVVNDVCENLLILENYDFAPMKAFNATKAHLCLSAEPGAWGDVVVPFAASVPFGIVMRTIDGKESLLSLKTTNVTTIPAMTSCLYLTSSVLNCFISAENVAIGTDTIASVEDGTVKGYTVKTTLPETEESLGLNTNGYPYYLLSNAGATVKAFSTSITKSSINIKALKNFTTDVQYMNLADTISRAYNVLQSNSGTDAIIINELRDSIEVAESAFTYQTFTTVAAIKQQYNNLSAAIEKYLYGIETDVDETTISSDDSDDSDAVTEYYTETGMRLTQPRSGINIVRKGRTVKKIFIK